MITMKFGGTSVGDAPRLREVVEIVRARRGEPTVVVASAMAGVTDTLLTAAWAATRGNPGRVAEMCADLGNKHRLIAEELVGESARREHLLAEETRLLGELAAIFQGIGCLEELSPRSLDAVAAFGEQFSCLQIAAVLEDNGIAARYVDARRLIRTDARFGRAEVDFAVSNEKLRAALTPLLAGQVVPVVTGFIAATEEGVTTTLGRSGSDYTGAIVGAALGSAEIWIWTDVSGVMTADPRYVKGARPLPEISYREAAEMAYFGAKVIHPKTMLPAIENNIPVRIKNTFNPGHAGTLITHKSGGTGVVKNVTSIDELAIVAVEGSGMMGVPGVAARIFTALGQAEVNVMMISQASSEHNVCLVVPRHDCRSAVEDLRKEFAADIERGLVDDVRQRDEVAIIAVVGEGMRGVPGIAARTFGAVARENVNVIAVAQGSSELNISLVVDKADVRRAVAAIHAEFIKADAVF